MLRVLLPTALAAAWISAVQAPGDPRAVVRAATRAVEGDSAATVVTQLSARLARSRDDRAALLGLATISRLRYDYPAAESTYQRLFRGPRDRFAVYAHLGRAEGLESRSFSRDSRPEFERARAAARAAGDRTAEGEALLWLAFIRGRLEGVAVAEALLDTAAHLIPATELDLQSRLRNRFAIVHALRARPAAALAEADTSILLARRARDPRAEADAFRVRGQVLQYRGRWDSAQIALRQSQELYLKARNRSALASSLIWHAQVLGGMARYGEMREVMQRALAEGEATHNPAAIADAHRALGVLAMMLGDWPGASSHLKQSAEITATTGDSSGFMTTQSYLAAVALGAGDVATARTITRERLRWARQTQDRGAEYEAWRALADIAAREKDWPASARALAGARAQLRFLPGPNRRAYLVHDEARLALARGDLAAAERSLQKFLQMSGGSATDYAPFDVRVRLADVYARRGEVSRAEQELLRATNDLEAWRARLGDAGLRTMIFQATSGIGAASLEPTGSAGGMARVIAALAGGGRGEAAYSLAERWRARELVDRLTRASALRTTEPLRSATPPAAVLSASEIGAALPDDRTALVQYVAAAGAPVTVFVVQRGGVKARALGKTESFTAEIARFISLIESGGTGARIARTLGAALADPALGLLDRGVTRLIIVPDGPLHRLPFDALRLPDGRHLIERYSVAIAPSGSAVAALWQRSRTVTPTAPVRLLALADPAISAARRGTSRNAASAAFLAAAEATGGLPRLRGAAREARLVARYAHTADVRLGKSASAAFLRQTDLRNYHVLHLATHAVVDDRTIAGTALALAPGNGEHGFVGAGDLAALRLNADLVVLSACRSAGGVVVGGEGVQGLTSPLLAAGTRSIVATHWRIRDNDVVPFVDTFYRGLARGLNVADALRAAKVDALQRGEPPRTWAAFAAIGDPLVKIPLQQPPKPWWSRLIRRR